jgi:beta-lactamase regulating signal transducer with metallopeptidase domain
MPAVFHHLKYCLICFIYFCCIYLTETLTTTVNSITYTDYSTMSDIIIESTTNKSHPTNALPETTDDGTIAIIVIVVTLAVIFIISFVVYIFYKKYLKRNMTSMNFDNPVYRKTTEDQFSLEKNQYPASRPYLSTVGEEAQQPLTGANPNDNV